LSADRPSGSRVVRGSRLDQYSETTLNGPGFGWSTGQPVVKKERADMTAATKRYLVASDFDQTLSFSDSGIVLSEVVGVPGFHEKVIGISAANLVQQGAELV
jgi:hypothetical protein